MNILINDIDCEQLVIGCMIENSKYFYESQDIINDDCFYDHTNNKIYKSIKNIVDNGNIPDIIAIYADLSRDTDNTITPDIITDIYSKSCWPTFRQSCIRLHDLFIRRQFWKISNQLMYAATNECETIEKAQSNAIDSLTNILSNNTSDIKSLSDISKEFGQIISDNASGNFRRGSFTGFSELDSKGGFMPTDLVVIAAESSQGKTALAINIAINQARQGEPIVFYSKEMLGIQIFSRILSSATKIPSNVLLNNKLNDIQYKQYDDNVGKIEHLPMYFDERSTSTPESVIASIRTMKIKYNIKGAYIDYIQLFNEDGGRNRESYLGKIARAFKDLAKELNIFIVVLSQLNRNSDKPEPTLARIRDSGQIVEAADDVILIYRPEYSNQQFGTHYEYYGKYSNISVNGTALINLAKGRNKGPCSFIAGFDPSTTTFYEMPNPPKIGDTQKKEVQLPF